MHTEHKGPETGGEWEPGPSEHSEYPETQVEVETPEQQAADQGQAKEAETKENDDDNQAGYGDFVDKGPAPPAQYGTGTDRTFQKASGEKSSSERQEVSFTKEGSTLTDTSCWADRPGGPKDFGDANDAFANPEVPDFSTVLSRIGPDPNVTDPANPGEDGGEMASLEVGSIRIDMAGTLRDGVDPGDPFSEGAPAPDRPKTSDAERTTSRDDDRNP